MDSTEPTVATATLASADMPANAEPDMTISGFRCVGGTTFRIQPPILAVGNAATQTLDFTGSGNESIITQGTTWNFQHWYRDPTAAPLFFNFNLSDGLAVTFATE